MIESEGVLDPRLDRRLTALAPTTTKDADGGIVRTYATHATCWCSRIDKGAREFRVGGCVSDETTAVFTVRFSDSMKAVKGDFKLACEGRTYFVTSPPREMNRRIWLLIEAKEIGAA